MRNKLPRPETGTAETTQSNAVIDPNSNLELAVETALRLAAARKALLTLSQVAEQLQLSRPTVWRKRNLKTNPLPTRPIDRGILRVAQGELDDWLERQNALVKGRRKEKKSGRKGKK